MTGKPRASSPPVKTYIVEHLDPELEQWSALEYQCIARECFSAGSLFVLSAVPPSLVMPRQLVDIEGLERQSDRAETLFANNKERVCLLDPAATAELSPEDGERFDYFLFGGILGEYRRSLVMQRQCRDHASRAVLILATGDDPPRDRTAELRNRGFVGRRLGPVQMTTDTAVRVTRIVVQDKSKNLEYEIPKSEDPWLISHVEHLESIPYIDHPEIRINKHESTEMPFRYVKDDLGNPVMPEGMLEVIMKDSEKGLDDIL